MSSYSSGAGSSRSNYGSTTTSESASTEFQNSTTSNNYSSGSGSTRNTVDAGTTAGGGTGKRYKGFIDTPSYAYTNADGSRYTFGPRSISNASTNYNPTALSTDWQRFIREAQATIDAVNAEYTGTTDSERLKFLQAIRAAIIKRGQFIQSRVSQLITVSKAKGLSDNEANKYLAVWGTAATLIPGAGLFAKAFTAVAAFVVNEDASDSRDAFLDRQRQLIAEYQKDYEALTGLLKVIDSEGEKIATTLNTTYNAPTAGIAWYWWVGGAIILLGLLYLSQRKRSKKRR